MPVVRRGTPIVFRRRRGMAAPNTLATGADAASICAASGMILSAAGNCVTPNLASASDISNQNTLLASIANPLSAASLQACAPPVYSSSFQPSSTPSDWTNPSYALNNQAQGTASQVNAQNARIFQAWQTSLLNWKKLGSKGSPPPCPTYVTFDQYWSSMNLGPVPSSISTQPPGTPLPAGTILTGALAAGGASYPISGPPTPAVVVASGPSKVVQSNAPAPLSVSAPGGAPAAQSNAPGAQPASGILQSFAEAFQNLTSGGTSSSSTGGTTTTATNWFGSIPNWVVIAGVGAVGLVFMFGGKGR